MPFWTLAFFFNRLASFCYRFKRIFEFSIKGLQLAAEGEKFAVVKKRLVRDLMPDLTATGGLALERVEGLAILANGDAVIATDNNGAAGSNGETQVIHLGPIFKLNRKQRVATRRSVCSSP